MGKYDLTEASRLAFEDMYIPNEVVWRDYGDNEDPFRGSPTGSMPENQYPIFISFFRVAGLRLPLHPLLVDFLREIRFHLCQLTPNVIRIILGVAS